MYKKTFLNNRVRLLLVPLKETQAINLLVMFRVGSRYETEDVAGVSHFIEHMMFKGTKNRPNTLAISRELDGVGAEFNAFTSKDYTGYYIKADARHLTLAADVLSDMLLNSLFAADELTREKGVIVEEINMYEDNPLMYVEDLLEQAMFKGNRLGRSIAGSRQTVKALTRQKMLRYKNFYYQPKNIVVTLAGNFSEAAAVALLKSKFRFSGQGAKSHFNSIKVSQRAPRVAVMFKETEQTQVALGFPAYSYFHKDIYALQLLSIILGGNMSSRLFLQVRERNGLAYYIRSSINVFEDTGSLVIQAGLDKQRIDQALILIRQELEKIKIGVTTVELQRAKEYLAGRAVLDLEDVSHRALFFGQQELLTEKILTPQEKIARVLAVTAPQIKKVAGDIIRWPRSSLAVIGPFKDKKRFEKILN